MGTRLLVGTTKGVFVLSTEDRASWTVSGPHCNDWTINHVVGDPASGRIWAGGGGDFSGGGVWSSKDNGENWALTRLTVGVIDEWPDSDPGFAKAMGVTGEPLPFGDEFSQIWSLGFAHGVLYAGCKPATLLKSVDGGDTWEKVSGLTDHPSRESWNGGAAGLVLHTIVASPDDPQKMWIGISAAGVFATEDGGISWNRRNRLSNAEACADHDHPAGPKDGETGLCVHNMLRASGAGVGSILPKDYRRSLAFQSGCIHVIRT